MAITREPVQVPDITVEGAYESRLRESPDRVRARGRCSPCPCSARIAPRRARREPQQARRVPPEVVELLRTFATQSALAIQNARLFRQLEAKSREVEVASRHKSEFLANMSPRAAHAAERHHRLQRDAPGGGAGSGAGGLRPRPREDQRRRQAPARADQRRPRPVQDRGRAGWSCTSRPSSVPALVRDIAAVVQPLAEQERQPARGARAPPDVGGMHADLTKVRQALFNLLSNACKFTERGTVTLGRRSGPPDRAADWLVFAVTRHRHRHDAGADGAALRGVLARPMPRPPGASAAPGLGLALSRRLCRLMGGDITVASERARAARSRCACPRAWRSRRPRGGRARSSARAAPATRAGARCWWSTTTRRCAS